MIIEFLPILMFLAAFLFIFSGYPVAFSLGGVAIVFYSIGVACGITQPGIISIIPARIFSIMSNSILLAIPYFVFMGKILEKTDIAGKMLECMGDLFGAIRGGLGITVIIVGALLAASTSVVAASVMTMGAITLPEMLKSKYSEKYAAGIIAAAGTLGQIIPPSIVLIFLADQMRLPVGDLFIGALFPGLLLCVLYIIYTLLLGGIKPDQLPIKENRKSITEIIFDVMKYSFPLILLIFSVLGSIFLGLATPTEAGALGAISAVIITFFYGKINLRVIKNAALETVTSVSSIMAILVGSTIFALVFRVLNGDVLFQSFLINLPGKAVGFIFFISLFVFILGFFLDFFEIVFIVIPLVLPVAEALDINLIWFAVLLSLNIQASFITPPFGFSLFFLKSSIDSSSEIIIETKTIYRGVIPFVIIQILCIIVVYLFPEIVLWQL